MHSPFLVKDLIKILQQKGQDKEVLIELGFNAYDILTIEETKDEIILYPKFVHLRDEPDEDKAL